MTQSSATVPAPRYGVERWGRLSISFTAFAVALAVAFAFVPVLFSLGTTQKATSLLILVLLAAMWNALAGYGGLVSVGQQAFIGLGAYATVWLCNHDWNPYRAMIVAALFCAGVSVPLSFLVLRFRGAQFAIGMWVVAEAAAILVSLDQSLGAGTGTSLIELNYYTPTQRQHYTYWLTLGITVFFLALLFLLLRSRLGSSLQAIRDDEDAAASVGVRVLRGKWILFVIAGAGCGAAGAMTLANTLFIEPTSIFGVDWTAYMIFMVLVGGLGTFEGPIIGAIVLFVIQNEFGDNGVWYLVGLGAAAIGFALLLPRGIWGTLEERFGLRVMPVGYRLRREGT
ncbi:MAG TPA: branched-chain amino acid ABC transporter permease [Gaiellaceae bacterium]|nr:branched-chain amino acid ABC transporter permease [Gaiellaceae bacterium]